MNLMFVNPITEQDSFLVVDYPKIDYIYWRNCIDVKNDNDIIAILNDKLKDLDCTKEYSYGRPMMTNYFSYTSPTHSSASNNALIIFILVVSPNTLNTSAISNYCYYLYKLTNQIIYNTYIDKLINRHIKNIVFEYEHPYIQNHIKYRKESKKKKLPPNKFIKYTTLDMFTNKKIYIYENARTKEKIESNNPDLLDELNAIKK